MIARFGQVLPEVWRMNAHWRGSHPAVMDSAVRWSWRQLGDRIDRYIAAFAEAELRKGDRVAWMGGNSAEMVALLMGAAAAGLVSAPLSTLLAADAIGRILDDTGAKLLLASRAYIPLATEAIENAQGGTILTPLETWVGGSPPATSASEPACVAPTDDFAILYSSGTTAAPKGIVHDHAGRMAFASGLAAALGIGADAVGLITTPLHTNGTWIIALPVLFAGGTLVVADRFRPDECLDLIANERVTHTFAVPAQLQALVSAPGTPRLGSLQCLLSAGSRLSSELRDSVRDKITPHLFDMYGCTEGIATLIRPGEFDANPGSVGRPFLGGDICILSEDGEMLPPGSPGEIAGRGPGVMLGYHERPDATAEVIHQASDGATWIRTGDIGELSEDGFLRIIDRKKEMIVSGGLNVYPSDIEAIVASHPNVAEVAVVGVPDDRWGEVPKAFVTLKPATRLEASELMRWTNARVSKHQRLADVELRTSLPRNALGKVVKRALLPEVGRK